MYPTLKAELARIGMSCKELARRVGISDSTLSQKMNGRFDFTLREAEAIKEVLGVDMAIDDLFERVA